MDIACTTFHELLNVRVIATQDLDSPSIFRSVTSVLNAIKDPVIENASR